MNLRPILLNLKSIQLNLKPVLLAVCLAAGATSAHAAKAYSRPFTTLQSDGTTLTVRLHGDESFSWYSTADGVILSRSGNDYYIAAIDADGDITPTKLLAHDKTQRSAAETSLAAAQDTAAFHSEKARQRRMASRRISISDDTDSPYFPRTGSPTAIVILAEYSDTAFTVASPQANFSQFFNGEELADYGTGESMNYGSVRQYFSDMSFGTFTPNFKVVGPVTLSNPMAYYGKNDGSTKDANCVEMIREACSLAEGLIDFSSDEYDSDGDGNIDLVCVVYAGYSEANGASASTIWPKSGYKDIGTYGGKKVGRYAVASELNANPSVTSGTFASPKINGIGVFCHEISHALGLPDIYPTVAAACIDNQAMEYWDLMDNGEYTKYGYSPTAYTAWEREVCGWHTITRLEDNATITLSPVNSGGASYKMANPNDEDEYFVLENIQRTGWNSSVPGHGLIVYHVKWATEGVSYSQRPNNTAGKPSLALVPADSILISSYNDNYTTKQYQQSHYGDAFPGTSSVQQLTYSQLLPNFCWYTDGPTVNKSLTGIVEDTSQGTVTFNYIHDTTNGIENPAASPRQDKRTGVYTADGIYMGKEMPQTARGLYIVDGKKVLKK